MSYVKLSENLYYGIHPGIVSPNLDVDHYINLTEDGEVKEFTTTGSTVISFPIKDCKAVSVKKLSEIVKYIRSLDGKVYVYCRGGHGRSGMVAAAVYGKENGLTGKEALDYVNKEWHKQRDMSKIGPKIRKLGSPQTQVQKHAVTKYLEQSYYSREIISRIFGMVFGHALGDALGAPSEFPIVQDYTGKLEFRMIRAAKPFFKIPQKTLVLGQITDDTEMAMVLARILKNGFTKEKAVLEYQKWANSKVPFLGKNTSKLFKGVKTYRGYLKRYEKNASTKNQGNGPLMRAYPLVVAPQFIKDDVYLTSPSELCHEMVKIYVQAIDDALKGENKKDILAKAISDAKQPLTIEALNQVKKHEIRDVSGKSKGWIAHSFYCAFYALNNFDSYRSGIDGVMHLDPFFNPLIMKKREETSRGETDTDTNCAIAGALLGAYYGFFEMCKDQITKKNLQILVKANPNYGDVPRPEEYHGIQLLVIATELFNMYGISN